jgi:hypothetical protein
MDELSELLHIWGERATIESPSYVASKMVALMAPPVELLVLPIHAFLNFFTNDLHLCSYGFGQIFLGC